VKQVGKGEFGEVWLGSVTQNNFKNIQRVAIKKLNNNIINNNELFEEAILLSELNHANLVKLYGICLDENRIKYLILEYMNMGDLLKYLRTKPKVY